MSECPSMEQLDALAAGSSDPALLAHVESCAACREVLDEVQQNAALLERLAARAPDESAAASLEQPFDGYRVVAEIHRGGQGIVYKALQLATRRTVAIKALTQGTFASPARRKRFEREIELVSGLRHPNIVTVHDSGTTQDGRDFLVMEYVRGVPLHRALEPTPAAEDGGEGEATDSPPGEVRDVLRLFAKVCEAVSFAHQHGVIHRDLKPNNVLVDSDGEPRVVDFGLAKGAMAGGGEGDDPLTVSGEFLGTLAFASPEQLSGDPHLVDVRSDVYSLGVMLYQILTRQPPYRPTSSVAGLVRAITESEPRPPSDARRRLSKTDHAPGRPAADADLDAITLKALAKDRERRYQSAGELARDLGRYVDGLPVDARRDSAWYVLRKAVRRHRLAVGIALGLAVLLVTAAVTSLRGWQVAASQGDQARIEATKSRELSDFLIELFASVDPHVAQGRDVRVLDVLDAAAARLETEAPAEPEVELSLRRMIGQTYSSLGLSHLAEPHLRAALALVEARPEARVDELVPALGRLGICLVILGVTEEPDRLFRRMDRLAAEADPPLPGDRGIALKGLGDVASLRGEFTEAEDLFQRAEPLLLEGYGSRSPELSAMLRTKAMMFIELSRLDEAAATLEQAKAALVRLETGGSGVADGGILHTTILREQARVASARGDHARAESYLEEATRLSERLLGAEHPATLLSLSSHSLLLLRAGRTLPPSVEERLQEARGSLFPGPSELVAGVWNNLGIVAEMRGELREAERCYRNSVESYRRMPGPFELERAVILGNLSWVLFRRGQGDEAEALGQEALELYERIHAAVDKRIRHAGRLAWILGQHGKQVDAAAVAETAVRAAREHLSPDHPRTGEALSSLGWARLANGRSAEAEELLREACDVLHRSLPENDVTLLFARHRLGASLSAQGKHGESEEVFAELADLYRECPEASTSEVVQALSSLGQERFRQNLLEDALDAFEEGLELCRGAGRVASADFLMLLNNTAALQRALDRPDLEESLLREAVTEARMSLAPNHTERLRSLRALRDLYLGQDRIEPGLAVQEELHACLRQAQGPAAPATTEAARELIDLYDQLGRTEDAKRIEETLASPQDAGAGR